MNKNFFKYLSFVLALVLAFALAACGTAEPAEEATTEATTAATTAAPTDVPVEPETEATTEVPTEAETEAPTEAASAYQTNTPADTLVVAYGAEMNGDFIEGFGNNAYDATIKNLLWNFYDTYYTNEAGELALNPTVVENLEITDDDAGNRTYTYKIFEDLKWSDGTPITAKDYLSEYLWHSSKQWVDAGATFMAGDRLIGYAAYTAGETEYFEGLQLIDEYTFSATIDGEILPYFYEPAYASFGPVPLHIWSPGNDVVSDESGARFANDIAEDAMRIVETADGERFAPSVTCGPYMFVSFENQICTLQKNPNFKTDYNGNVPNFEFVVQQAVPEETDIDLLLAGDIDVLPDMIEGNKIDTVKASEFGGFSSYLRNGYGVLNYSSDWGPTADVNVRWALASLVNRDALLDQVLGGYGGLVNGEYGVAQWMYQAKSREINSTLKPIAMNIDVANDYLDQSEWKFEADGVTPFDRTKANADGTYMRHNAEGEMLVLHHAAASADVGAALEIEFLKNTPLAGMQYDFETPDFNIILDQWYMGFELPDEERIYHTYSMGLGFAEPYDPYYSWHSDMANTDYNPGNVIDEQLDEIIIAMNSLDPSQRDEYADLWLQYQVRWNEILPAIPLYSNEYFTLFNSIVTDVPATPFYSWDDNICTITKNAQ